MPRIGHPFAANPPALRIRNEIFDGRRQKVGVDSMLFKQRLDFADKLRRLGRCGYRFEISNEAGDPGDCRYDRCGLYDERQRGEEQGNHAAGGAGGVAEVADGCFAPAGVPFPMARAKARMALCSPRTTLLLVWAGGTTAVNRDAATEMYGSHVPAVERIVLRLGSVNVIRSSLYFNVELSH